MAKTGTGDSGKTDKVKLQLGCNVTLFNTELHSIYQYEQGNEKFLIYEPDAGEHATGITLDQIKDQIENMINLFTGDKTTVTLNLPDKISKLAKNLEIYIRQVFLKAQRVSAQKWSLSDYALWISIETTDELKATFNLPLMIDKVFLKLWKTDNDYIKSTMNITQVEQLLPSSVDE